MLLDECRYVVVEGPIGAGKTSLAERLAKHYGANTLLEKPEENPFLTRFYKNPARYALPTQLFFLFQRIDEMRDLAQMDLFHGSTVAD
jgi:deoxyguanosine kinase